ncbi:MAG TPA: cytidylate kinase-like family protein [Dehalococcoidia bacterium]|nr:cytidylate kinase-like family protein [Dehalococcoidia bacterium]
MAQANTTIIAISRQLGASSHAIADMVAEQLGLPLFDQEIINRAASAAGVEEDVIIAAESVPSLITRIVEHLGRHPLAMEPESLPATVLPNDLILTSSDYRYLIDSVVQQIAEQQSAVILGHGAAQTLADRPGVLRVFVLAPFESRVRRHVQQTNIPEEQARQEIRENDKSRAEFFRHYYDMDWLNARRYDLVLNTGRLSDRVVSDLIVQTARAHLGFEMPRPG